MAKRARHGITEWNVTGDHSMFTEVANVLEGNMAVALARLQAQEDACDPHEPSRYLGWSYYSIDGKATTQRFDVCIKCGAWLYRTAWPEDERG